MAAELRSPSVTPNAGWVRLCWEDRLENDRHNRLQGLRRRLDDLMREVQSLKDEHQEALLMEMESFVGIIEESIHQIDHPPFRHNRPAADMPKMPFHTPFQDWFREEVRRGVVYASIAEAAVGYEDAGYTFKGQSR